MDNLRFVVFSVVLVFVLAEEVPDVKRSGLVGNSIKLSCPLPYSQPPKVRWEDTVHMSDRDPILIFSSENNTNFAINSKHPNKVNYKVDRNNFDLKISRLTYNDVGSYTCLSDNGTSVNKASYNLFIHGSLKCEGETQLREGQTTSLKCNLNYAGSQPILKWYRDNHIVPSIDKTEFNEDGPVAEMELNLTATHEFDGQTFQCNAKFPDKQDNCSLIFNVTYPVRDVEISNNKTQFYVGDEVICIARGNPVPEISLVPTMLEERTDNRKKSKIIIPKTWEGQEKTVECTASNVYQGKSKTVKKQLTFQVLAVTTTTTTTTIATTTTTTTTTAKPIYTEPNKAALGDNSGSENLHGSGRIFLFLVFPVTLMKILVLHF